MKKRILPAVCVMCICVMLLTSCAAESAVSEPSNLDFLNKNSSNQPNEEDFPDAVDDYKTYIQKANIVKGNETISYNCVKYSDIKIVKTKKLPNGILEDIDYMNDGLETKTDEEGTIINNNSYLFVSTRITNKENEKMLIPLQAMVVELDEQLSYRVCILTNVYRSGKSLVYSKKSQKKDYYMQYFKPNESTVYTMAIIVNDDIINNDNLYLILRPYYTKKYFTEKNSEIEEDKAYKIN